MRAELETPGEGRVLVVDGGASLKCALIGANLGALGALKLGIKALATHPRNSSQAGAGQRGARVAFAGVEVSPGDWVYADEDGWLVSPIQLRLGD